jgi:autotransporter-associated beta strand protein
LTVTNTLTELGRVLNQFDLSNDPTGTTNANDTVTIYGNLVLTGTNTIAITQLNGALGGGVYPLFKYTGTLSGGLANLALSGAFIQPVSLTNPPGMIGLVAVIPAAPPVAPSALVATAVGAFQINLAWTDNSSDENAFFIERSTSNTANFAQIALNAPNDTSYQDTGVAANTTYYYRVRGTNLAGASAYSNTNNATTTPPPASLTWRGDGTGNLWDAGGTLNWSDGANLVVYSDGTTITFDQSGSNNTSTTLSGTLQPNSVTVNATKNYSLTGNGVLASAMTMTKSNSGTFTINTTNTFSGGINLNAGTVSLGNAGAGGVGALRFNGGALTFSGSGQPTFANPLTIAANGTITSSGGNNNIVSGAWSGANTLNIAIASGTFTLGGNLTGFSGTVALGNSAGFLRFYGSTGNANTTFDLGTGTATLNNRNGVTITLGALTGGSGTFVSGAGASDAPSTYIIGGKNLSTTFAGTIQNASSLRTTAITKVGNGSLTLTGNNPYSGGTTVSAGKLVVNGNQSSATGAITVAATGTLGGTGTIGGPATISGTLAPGNSIGTLTFNQNLTLATGSFSQFEISKNPFTNDTVIVGDTVTYAGTLNVLNTSLELFTAGDNFQLFSAASYANSFAAMNLPVLDDGLAWNSSQLTTDGRLWVVSTIPPVISNVGNSGNDLTFSGTGGTPNWTYFVLTATNAALPVGQWSRVATNQFDAAGSFNFSTPLDPAAPQQFYRLQAQ